MNTANITLNEWETRGPNSGKPLAGWGFEGDSASRILAEKLTQYGWIEVLELARGIELRATSFVGRFTLGSTSVTVQPKIEGAPFLGLLRYAYGFRRLKLFKPVSYDSSGWDFRELLIQQLTAEVRELLARGVHRDYERRHADLASLRGRIEFSRFAGMPSHTRATIPCIYYPRIEDTLLNQVLLAGLAFAVHRTVDVDLRYHVSHLLKLLNSSISLKPLNAALIIEAKETMDRRTTAYESAVSVIELLYQAHGLSLDEEGHQIRLPGFLFDMNRFFQASISRFLHAHLQGYTVHDEHRMKTFFAYDPERNPRGLRATVPRPDFAILQNRHIVIIADAKYRDLWEKPLPREMLYQLAVYALAQGGDRRKAVILYPTLSDGARDQALGIHEPVGGEQEAEVILRPVNLLELDGLLHEMGSQSQRRKSALARHLVFGSA